MFWWENDRRPKQYPSLNSPLCHPPNFIHEKNKIPDYPPSASSFLNDLKFPAIGQLWVTNSEGSGVGPNSVDAVNGAMRGKWGVAMAGSVAMAFVRAGRLFSMLEAGHRYRQMWTMVLKYLPIYPTKITQNAADYSFHRASSGLGV